LRLLRISIPVVLVGALAALAVGLASAQQRDPYYFGVDTATTNITETAAEVVIEPRFRAVVDDQFPYEIYVNTKRTGTSSEGTNLFDTFRRTESWIVHAQLIMREDELERRKDPLLAFQYGVPNDAEGKARPGGISFLIDNGRGRYSGYIGPAAGGNSAKFQEILPDGARSDVTNIPGWPGISASGVESSRSAQAGMNAASLWVSMAEDGRPHNPQYYVDWNDPDQRSYPGQLIEPLHLLLGLHTHFAKDTKLKLGESVKLTRGFPVGVVPGAAAEYEFSYKLENLYGTLEEPTAARFSFTAAPRAARQAIKVGELLAEFDAPAISGTLLFDLLKGVTADIAWAGAVKGLISQPGTELRTEFASDMDFRASLMRKPPK